MGLFLFRFWPVFIPLIIYWIWHIRAKKRAAKDGKPIPHFRDGPWYWAVLASLLTAIGCFIYIATLAGHDKGTYVPPHVEDGKLIPGHVDP